MILRQKIGLISTSAVIGLMVLFPPYEVKTINGMTIKAGYDFVFSLPAYIKDTIKYNASVGDIVPYTMNIPATVNFPLLLAQILGALIVGGVFYVVLRD